MSRKSGARSRCIQTTPLLPAMHYRSCIEDNEIRQANVYQSGTLGTDPLCQKAHQTQLVSADNPYQTHTTCWGCLSKVHTPFLLIRLIRLIRSQSPDLRRPASSLSRGLFHPLEALQLLHRSGNPTGVHMSSEVSRDRRPISWPIFQEVVDSIRDDIPG